MPVIGGSGVGTIMGAVGAPAAYLAPSGGDDTVALQTLFDNHVGETKTVRLYGTYTISDTITVRCNLDAVDAEFRYTALTGTALRVGAGGAGIRLFRLNIGLPRVILTSKVTGSWRVGTIGVRVVNLYGANIVLTHIVGFETGLSLYGEGTGCVYNQINGGHLDNNKVNETCDADSTGWCNQNTFVNVRHSHNSGEGQNAPGTRHLLIPLRPNGINNNTWINASMESPGVVEKVIECGGSNNMWISPRLENSERAPVIKWGVIGKKNVLLYGTQAEEIIQESEAGSGPNMILHSMGGMWQVSTPVKGTVLENLNSSNAPIFTLMDAGAQIAGTDEVVGWRQLLSAARHAFKASADAFPRVEVQGSNGRVYLGPGSVAAAIYFYATASTMVVVGGLSFQADNTHDLGGAGLRPRKVIAGTSINPPSMSTVNRPAVATVGVGGMVYDSSLGKPIWCNGSGWVDASGAVV